MKIVLSTVFVLLSVYQLFGQDYIHTKDNVILSAAKEVIVFRGVNEMFVWAGTNKTGEKILPEIAKTKANSVRLVWNTTDGTIEEFEKLIGNTLANKMIPIAELHDATGDFSKLDLLLNWWTQPKVLQIIKKYEKWLIVNVGNEVGNGSESDSVYLAKYKSAITKLRESGIQVPLMIDAGGWGNQEKYVINSCEQLMIHDSLSRTKMKMHTGSNLIFSVHTYWTGSNQINRMRYLMDVMKSKKAPLCFGEGPQKLQSPNSCSQKFPFKDMMALCQQEDIGWLAWSWGVVKNRDCSIEGVSEFDLTTDGKFGNWATPYAESLCSYDEYSIRFTSRIPASMLLWKE
jgi:hypothetical protein